MEWAASPVYDYSLKPLTDSVARMAALQQDGRLDVILDEILGPTAVTLLTALPEAYTKLQKAGYVVIAPPQPGPPSLSENADAADQSSIPSPALLWLAGRFYQALGEHLPTLAPLPTAVLDQIRQQMDPAVQAIVQSQFALLHTQLLQILDGYHLMPPTIPALYAMDHAAIRQQLEEAIAAKRWLQMQYYTAGRNLVTERTIEPYWVEEKHGTHYLRAYCHSAGSVLTFRLDRIERLIPA